MDNRPIGLLDSGVGGLTVVKKVIQKLPNESTVFIGDNAHIPYGDKTNEEVIALTRRSVKFLLNKNVKLIIFACNTATAAAMDVIQDEIKPQIIGVIQSGSLAAARTTKNKKVAVVATNVTVASHAYKKEIRFRDPNIQVTELAAPKLVPLVENGADYESCLKAVQESLLSLKGKDFDTLVLGCTHYPIIRKEFAETVNKNVQIVDPADQVAQYTFNVMRRDGLFSDDSVKPVHAYYTTGDEKKVDKLGRSFLNDPSFIAKHIDSEKDNG
ncbi:glutamate racemase [Lactobacillus acetotolerans]|jgi:glutamate racemase|uniref:Glutamate racemase n=3 Tax=Lactobacillus acetotolerans TaxID=1600 RepID=A0A0D6A2G4_9LACO|nr:glutamate racemase [Lactobacillus acetotolerans]KRN42096.1 glutamate racemase [Lactobacillus acetotolerans DSM 20749 = JCM 3825]QFG50951.1 glutamate racemase [Lactobacillus acetotolerans]QGV04942.1 glutamate racemase [Lactobacillus acetotolerans]QJD72444.1 glutamate racemase [Lactobacillus acetotolerans]BAQ56864.1 glutamate racemase [Lactobacillus acetotolerans]